MQFIILIGTSAFVEIHTLEDYNFTSSDDAMKDIFYLHDSLSRQCVRKYSLLVTSQLLLSATCHTKCLLFGHWITPEERRGEKGEREPQKLHKK